MNPSSLHRRRYRSTTCEVLEPRRLLTVEAFVEGSALRLVEVTPSDDRLEIRRAGNVIRVHDSTTPITAGNGTTQIDPFTVEVDRGSIDSVFADTGGGGDVLTVDHTNSALDVPLEWVGDGVADVLAVVGNSIAATIDRDDTTASVTLDGQPLTLPAATEIDARNLSTSSWQITYHAANESVVVSDAGNGSTRVESSLVGPLTFAHPTSDLTVSHIDGEESQIELASLAMDYPANVSIVAAGSGKEVMVSSDLSIDGDFDVYAVTVRLNGGTIETTGDQTYGLNVLLGGDLTLNGANVTFEGRVDSDTVTNVGYTDLETFQTPLLDHEGVLVTGSANVNVREFNGLGIVGGISDISVDSTEFIEFDFGVEREAVKYYIGGAGNANGGPVGELTMEAFDDAGNSLGAVMNSGVGFFDAAAMLGHPAIRRLRLTANQDYFRLSGISYGMPAALTVNVAENGIATFAGNVGERAELSSLTVESGGTTLLTAREFWTRFDQHYLNAVMVADETSLTANDVTFAATVNSGYTTVDFRQRQTPSPIFNVYEQDHIDFSGSAEPRIRIGQGVGIEGGTSPFLIDGSEFIVFEFDYPALSVDYDVEFADDADGDLTAGERTVEAFDESGNSLGTVSHSGDGHFDLSADFPGQSIKSFRVTAEGDGHRINFVSFTGPVPLDIETHDQGTISFGGPVGGTIPLRRITTNADGTVSFSAETVTTTRDQSYGGPVQLVEDLAVQGQNVLFDGPVDALDAATTAALTVAARGGDITFGGPVGGTFEVQSLTTSGDGAVHLDGAAVTTRDEQHYANPVLLGSDMTLTASQVQVDQSVNSDIVIEIDFTELDTFTTAELEIGGIRVSGSNDVANRRLNGVGIAGGASDTVDPGEWIEFDLGIGRTDIAYTSGFGERSLEAFGPLGESLGVVSHSENGASLGDDYPGERISRFRLSPVDRSFRVGTIWFGEAASLTIVGGLQVFGPIGDHRPLGQLELRGDGSRSIESLTVAASVIELSGPATFTGDTTLIADEIDLQAGVDSVVGIGTLAISPATPSLDIRIGGDVDSGDQVLDLTDADLAALANGFASIEIGSLEAGDLVLDTATFHDPLTLITGGFLYDGGGVDIVMTDGDPVTIIGTVAPGQSPGELRIDSDVAFDSGATVQIEFGIAAHDRIVVEGDLAIADNVALDLVAIDGFAPASGDIFIIVGQTGDQPVDGQFTGLSEGMLISNIFNSGLDAAITYRGGDGNDIALEIDPRPAVVGRHLFYNDSAFDGSSDDDAIASDKRALLPNEGPATFANYSNTPRGITGVMIDIRHLPAGTTITPGVDLLFRVGNDDTPANWRTLTSEELPAFAVADERIKLIWSAGTIVGQWLQITVKGNANTGLDTDDTFYFGNAPGETTGWLDGATTVDAADFLAVRQNRTSFLDPAAITNLYDVNRDGRVNSADLIVVRDSTTSIDDMLRLISPTSGAQGKLPLNVALPSGDEGERTTAPAKTVHEPDTQSWESLTDAAILQEYAVGGQDELAKWEIIAYDDDRLPASFDLVTLADGSALSRPFAAFSANQ